MPPGSARHVCRHNALSSQASKEKLHRGKKILNSLRLNGERRQRDREIERQKDREPERDSGRQRYRETERDRETERQRHSETEKRRERDREIERQRDRSKCSITGKYI